MIVYLFFLFFNEVFTVLFSKFYLTNFQQLGYKMGGYLKWLKNNYLPKINYKAKVPLKITKRIVRLYIAILILSAIVPFVFLPFTIVLANIINYPMEKLIAKTYIHIANMRLNYFNGIKIGITGSYGKTSVKNILATILSEKYKVLYTPNSFNTPLGIAKAVQNLNNTYEVFIAEMGARRVGDIKKICKIVNPSIGIITGINNQHLESFKSEKNIIKTKYELINSLPNSGKGFFNLASDKAKKLFAKFNGEKYGVNVSKSFVYYSIISQNELGTTFLLYINGKRIAKCNTKLLGKHNVENICLAVSVAIKLGLSIKEIVTGINKIKPIHHRLELVANDKDITIIDDSYNSNENGANESLNVLSNFNGRKIIITPGLVELGIEQYNSNYEFGKKMAKVCDKAFIVGKCNKLALFDGLIKGGKDKSDIYLCETLKDAQEKLQGILIQKDVVLFENDLPDNYN